jgi:hypothetical protein
MCKGIKGGDGETKWGRYTGVKCNGRLEVNLARKFTNEIVT